MNRFLHLLMLSACFYCCKSQANHDLQIPDQVSITKKSTDQQFIGTRVFLDKPEGYELVKSLIRFQKNENTFIQVIESPATNFEVQKSAVKKSFEDAINSGKLSQYYYHKEFKLGNYQALLYYGSDNKPNLEQIALCFGDKDFSVLAIGQIAANDKKSRDEILKGLLSLYVDKTIKSDPSALATYSLDVANTEFQYHGNVSQMFFYTIGGLGDPINNPTEDQIMISTLPYFQNDLALKNYAIELIQRYKSSGMEIPEYKGRDITLNGKYAYEITFNGVFKGKTNTTYQVVMGDDKSSVLFVGSVYNRQGELMKQIKTIAQTLQTR